MKDSDKGFGLYLRGNSYDDIANKLGVSLATVKSWVTRYDWVKRRKGCIKPDGSIDKAVLAEYAEGKGCMTVARDEPLKSKLESLYQNPKDRDTALFIHHTVHHALDLYCNTQPSDDNEVNDRIISYFTICQEEAIPPTMEGLWLCLGVGKTVFYEWRAGKRGTVRAEILKRAQLVIAECDTQMAIAGKMPQILYIFRSKNFYGMKDQVENVITHNTAETASVEDIAQRLADQLPIEEAEYSEIDINIEDSTIDT